MTDSVRVKAWGVCEGDFSEDSIRVISVIFFHSFSQEDSDEVVDVGGHAPISEMISRYV